MTDNERTSEGTHQPTPSDIAAARVALLAARTAVWAGAPGRVRGYVVTPDSAPVPEEAAVGALAALPKPLVCTPTLRGDVLELACQPPSRPGEAAAYAEHRAFWERRGGYYRLLREQFGAEYPRRTVLCAGDGEYLAVHVADMEAYHRDYHIVGAGWAGDKPGSMWADHHGLTAAARERGADFITMFFPPDASNSVTLTVVEDLAPEDGQPSAVCERCGVRPATRRHSSSGTWGPSERLLCDQCTAEEGAADLIEFIRARSAELDRYSPEQRAQLRTVMDKWVARMERHWGGLPMPPEVEAFLRKLREP